MVPLVRSLSYREAIFLRSRPGKVQMKSSTQSGLAIVAGQEEALVDL
jgi:hypothetical protein